jgi:hypothetical protein
MIHPDDYDPLRDPFVWMVAGWLGFCFFMIVALVSP